METPAASFWRTATETSELGGVTIPAGARLLVRYGSANRDEQVYDDPERFDIAREFSKPHLAFGRGVHACIGAPLARKETCIAFTRLLQRLENIRLDDQQPAPTYPPNIVLRGLDQLYIKFDQAA